MHSLPTVCVVVLNWNGWQHTIGCLDSLRRLDYPNYRIIAVDNGSTDGSPERIRAAHEDIELIQVGENLGYAGGNNVGIGATLDRRADYVWVLNNDVLVEPATLSALVDAARSRPQIGIAGSAVWTSTEAGEPDVEAAAFQWRGEYRLPAPCPEPAVGGLERLHPVDDVAGTSVLLDTTMLRQVGAFDERFFHYWEDVELCVRARGARWSVVHSCQSRVWHVVGGSIPTSSAQGNYYYVRNWLLFSRWTARGSLVSLLLRAPRLTIARVFGVRWLRQRRWKTAFAGVIGASDALRGRHGRRDLPGWIT